MILTLDQITSLEKAALPLTKWLNKNAHPHVQVHVDQISVEVTETLSRSINSRTRKVTPRVGEPK